MQGARFHTEMSLQGGSRAGCSWWGAQPCAPSPPQCPSSPVQGLARQLWPKSPSNHWFSAGCGPQAARGTAAAPARGRTDGLRGRGRPGSFKASPYPALPATPAKPQPRCFLRRGVRSCTSPDARLHPAPEKPQHFSPKLPRKKMLHVSGWSLVLSSISRGCKASSACRAPRSRSRRLVHHHIQLPASCTSTKPSKLEGSNSDKGRNWGDRESPRAPPHFQR